MDKNVGNSDKMVRIALGVLLIAIGFYYQSWWGLIGLIPLLTGIINFCPLYRILGINTCKFRK